MPDWLTGAGTCRTSPRATERPEHQTPDRSVGCAQPSAHLPAVARVCRAEHRPMVRRTLPIGTRIGNDHPHGNARRIDQPCALTGDLRGVPLLPVERPDQLVHVDELGLELNDNQRSRPLVPRDEVDDSSLAEVRERHLRREPPPSTRLELARDRRVHRRVPSSEQAVEVTASPSPDDIDAHVERSRHSPDYLERHGRQMTALHPRHGALADPGPSGEVLLAPAAADPEEADRGSEPLIGHGRVWLDHLIAGTSLAYPPDFLPAHSPGDCNGGNPAPPTPRRRPPTL